MSEIVRVARNNSAVIYRSDDVYVKVDVETKSTTSAPTLAELSLDTKWRRPVSSDVSTFGALPARTVVARKMRVPESVLTALSDSSVRESLSADDVVVVDRLVKDKAATAEDAQWLQDTLFTLKSATAVLSDSSVSTWVSKVLPVTASAEFEVSDSLDYFGAGDDAGTEEITTLIALTEEDKILVWDGQQFNEITDTLRDYDRDFIIELDDDTAAQIARWVTDGSEGSFILDDIDDEELTLFQAAESELDWEFLSNLEAVVADATGYSSLERSRNAQVQRRGPGGTFAPGGSARLTSKPRPNRSRKLSQWHRARLKFILPLILDPDTKLSDWISSNPALWNMKSSRYGLKAAGDAVEEVEQDAPSTSSLYYAIVDPDDHEAVFDVIAIQGDAEGSPIAWKRESGAWVDGSDFLEDFKGASPPPVVQLSDEETVKDVLGQIDSYDAENPPEDVEESMAASGLKRTGFAMPDGAFLIEDEEDLETAIKSYEESDLDDVDVRAHIRKRAAALNRSDLIPQEWKDKAIEDLTTISASASVLYGPYGEVYSLVAAGVPGIADTPSDLSNAKRLKEYWMHGKGAAKVRWGTDGDLTRCHRQLSKYMPTQAWGYCQNLHQELFGMSNYKRDNK